MSFNTPKNIRGGNLFAIFTDECGGPKKVAEFLAVSERTVKNWITKDCAPRAAVVALYWETNYGRSQLSTDQMNVIRLLYRRVAILESQYARASAVIAGLRRLQGDTANEGFFDELPAPSTFSPGRYAVAAAAPPGWVDAQQQPAPHLQANGA